MNVQGRCPACGEETLFLGDGGYVTCSLVDCPDPESVTKLLAENELLHRVQVTDHHFTTQHPLYERLQGAMFDCSVHRHVAEVCRSGQPPAPGTYTLTETGRGWDWKVIA